MEKEVTVITTADFNEAAKACTNGDLVAFGRYNRLLEDYMDNPESPRLSYSLGSLEVCEAREEGGIHYFSIIVGVMIGLIFGLVTL